MNFLGAHEHRPLDHLEIPVTETLVVGSEHGDVKEPRACELRGNSSRSRSQDSRARNGRRSTTTNDLRTSIHIVRRHYREVETCDGDILGIRTSGRHVKEGGSRVVLVIASLTQDWVNTINPVATRDADSTFYGHLILDGSTSLAVSINRVEGDDGDNLVQILEHSPR